MYLSKYRPGYNSLSFLYDFEVPLSIAAEMSRSGPTELAVVGGYGEEVPTYQDRLDCVFACQMLRAVIRLAFLPPARSTLAERVIIWPQ
jgi:hypothetical protein